MQALYKKFGIKVIRVSLIRRADYRNQMPNYCYKLVAPALPVPLRRLYHRYGLLGRGAFGEAPAGRVMGKSGKATSVRVSGQDARKGQVQRNRELVERDEFGEDADVDACADLWAEHPCPHAKPQKSAPPFRSYRCLWTNSAPTTLTVRCVCGRQPSSSYAHKTPQPQRPHYASHRNPTYLEPA